MDAGWYGMGTLPSPDEYEGDWAQHTGDWRVNPTRHPDGLMDVAAAVEATDKRYLLWFEPEPTVLLSPPSCSSSKPQTERTAISISLL